MRRLSDGGVVHVQVTADRAHHDLAGVEAHADVHRGAAGPLELVRVEVHPPLHSQCGVAGSHRVVFVSQRGAEERHDAVAHDLVHGTLVAVHRLHHALDHGIEEFTCFLGIAVGQQLHGALQVGEEHRHLLAFPFEGGFGVQNFLSEVSGGVAKRCVGL
jgi:hypothetical protein